MKSFFLLFATLISTILFAQTNASATATTETFTLAWPAAEHWKIANEQDDATQHALSLVHANETTDVWTELANMTTLKGITGVPVDIAMKQVFDQAKKSMQKPVITVIEKDAAATYPWILFTIESPNFKKNSTPESQLWYIVQGNQALYTNFIAMKLPAVPAEAKQKWTKFFREGKVE